MTFLGLNVIGWAVAVAVGFVVGGLFFLSMKWQVDYVVQKRGPTWVAPAAMYARMLLMAAALVITVLAVPRPSLAGAFVGGLIGVVLARVFVARQIKRTWPADRVDKPDNTERD